MMDSRRLGTSDHEWGFSVKMGDQIKCSYLLITKLCGRIPHTNYILANYYINTLIEKNKKNHTEKEPEKKEEIHIIETPNPHPLKHKHTYNKNL